MWQKLQWEIRQNLNENKPNKNWNSNRKHFIRSPLTDFSRIIRIECFENMRTEFIRFTRWIKLFINFDKFLLVKTTFRTIFLKAENNCSTWTIRSFAKQTRNPWCHSRICCRLKCVFFNKSWISSSVNCVARFFDFDFEFWEPMIVGWRRRLKWYSTLSVRTDGNVGNH